MVNEENTPSPKEYLTTEEVAERLNVKTATIYKYVREKKLVPLYDHKWRMRRTKLFPCDQVEKLEKALKKPGFTTGEVADALKIHVATVNSFINDGTLSAVKHLYKGREIYFISEEEFERFKAAYRHQAESRLDKKFYYLKDQGFLLFQLFINKYTHEHGRLMEITEEKSKIVTEHGEILPLDVAEKRGFECYQKIENRDYSTRRGYAKFRFSRPFNIKSSIYTAIELIYAAAGPQNIRIDLQENFIELEVKPSLVVSTDQEILEVLKNNILEGKVLEQPEGVFLDSDLEPFNISIPSELKDFIKTKAKKENKSMEQIAVEAFDTVWEWRKQK